jgi:signal transduction histidine kinase
VKQQQQQAAPPEPGWRRGTAPFDALRFEQFLDLQRALLASAAEPEELAESMAQRIAVFLGVPGVAVGAVEDGLYRLVGTYGLGADYALRYNAAPLRDSLLGGVLASGRGRVVAEEDAGSLRTLLLPFGGVDVVGALHLVLRADDSLPEPDLALARAVALFVGLALVNARQWRRLTKTARLRSDALTGMAHDLRAPLNALIGYTSLLGEGAFGPLTEEQREVSATLERQALELVDLLGATLDVARLETGRLPVRSEEFFLADVLGVLLSGTFAQPSRDGGVRCRLPAELPPLRTDRVKVKQIVQNLVDNALKHSGGGPVDIDVALASERGVVRITVRDAGPGIAADVLPHLFEPFRPGSTGARSTGFGLYLVRSFVEALGGRVAARSLPGEGTAVTVELPLTAPSS